MPESAAQAYAALIDAADAQRQRLSAGEPVGDRWGGAADRFTADPRRQLDANLIAIRDYLRPEHVLLDVGGGAGRYALPLALHCREVINVEPSRGMGEAFEASAREAGIENARWIAADWLGAGELSGDVSLVVNVTYFVRDIVPFLEKLAAASRERVIIATSITPPPNQGSRLFELINGEPQARVPGYRELLAVLWEMGVVPDVRVLHEARSSALGGVSATREEAIDAAAASPRRSEQEMSAAAGVIAAHFDELFEAVPGGFRRRTSGDARMILISWQTGGVTLA